MSFVEVVKEGTMNRPHGKLSEGARKEEDKGMGEDHKNFHREGDFRRPQRQEGGGGENFNTSFRGVGETQGSLAISRVESLKKEILTGLLDMEISLEGAFF
jgi:hypothetical protein